MKGMTECSTHPIIQQITQQFRTTGPVLGYYLNNTMYKNIYLYKPGETALNDYFMIYGEYLKENVQAAENDLEMMEKNLEQTLFDRTNFEQISSKTEDPYGNIIPDKPVLLEKYSSQPNVRTMIVLLKYKNGTSETTVISAVNCILIKKRLITLAYYLSYNGGKTIDSIKQKNKEVVKKLMEAN
jgi:hypothetical protein